MLVPQSPHNTMRGDPWNTSAADSHLRRTACKGKPTTLIYFGADVDIAPLHFLQLCERRVVFIDPLIPADGTRLPAEVFSSYDSLHSNDTRVGYTMTTQTLRTFADPMRVKALAQVLTLRLHSQFKDVVRHRVDPRRDGPMVALRFTFSTARPEPTYSCNCARHETDDGATHHASQETERVSIELLYMVARTKSVLFHPSSFAALDRSASTFAFVGNTPSTWNMRLVFAAFARPQADCLRILGRQNDGVDGADNPTHQWPDIKVLKWEPMPSYPLVDTIAGRARARSRMLQQRIILVNAYCGVKLTPQSTVSERLITISMASTRGYVALWQRGGHALSIIILVLFSWVLVVSCRHLVHAVRHVTQIKRRVAPWDRVWSRQAPAHDVVLVPIITQEEGDEEEERGSLRLPITTQDEGGEEKERGSLRWEAS